MKPSLRLAAVAAAALWATPARAVPNAFTYSGFLLDAGGDPVTVPTTVTFGFFDTASLNTTAPNHTEALLVTPSKEGYVSAIVGASVPSTFFAGNVWLTLKMSGEEFMLPRLQLTSAPAALAPLTENTISNSASVPANSCVNAIEVTCPAGTIVSGVGCSSFSGSLVISNQWVYGGGTIARCGFCNNAAFAQSGTVYAFCTGP